jgi:hypothetical protein
VKFGENIKWTSPETGAAYNGDDGGIFAEVGPAEHNGPPLIIAGGVQGAPIAPRN